MATFGNIFKEDTSYNLAGGIIRGSWFPCLEVGTATSITVYLEQYSTRTPNIKCAIYRRSDDVLIAYTEEWTLTDGWDNWKTLNIIWGGILAATDYYLVFWQSDTVISYYYLASGKGGQDSEAYNSFPGSWDPTAEARRWSIYCTYTPAGVDWTKSLSDTVSITDAISKGVGVNPSDSVALADSFARQAEFHLAPSDTVAIADVISKGMSIPLGDAVAIADSIVTLRGHGWEKSLSDVVAIVDSLSKGIGLNKADSVDIADALSKAMEVAASDTVDIADTIAKAMEIPLADAVTIADAIIKEVDYSLSLLDTVTIADAISKGVGISLADSIAIADVIIKLRNIVAVRGLSAARVLDAIRNLPSERTRPPE